MEVKPEDYETEEIHSPFCDMTLYKGKKPKKEGAIWVEAVMTLPQQQRAWQALQQQYPQGETVHTFPDNWTVKRHTSPESMVGIGTMMHNCWQDPEGFPAQRLQGIQNMPNPEELSQYPHSLHDENDIPRGAFWTRKDWGNDTPYITQALGPRNNDLGPQEIQKLQEFGNQYGYDVPTFYPQKQTLGNIWVFADEDEFHVALQVPKNIQKKIKAWVDEQDWPKGTELEAPEDYHITLLYAPEGYEDHKDEDWVRKSKGYDCEIYDVDIFEGGDEKAIVLRVRSPEIKNHAYDLQDMAENRDLDISRFPGGYKPHLTIAYGPSLPKGIKAPQISFKTGPVEISEPRTSSLWVEASSPYSVSDPLVCPNCGNRTSEPHQLQGTDKWITSCPSCKGTYTVPPNSPLLNQWKSEWAEYPDLLKQVNNPNQMWAFASEEVDEEVKDKPEDAFPSSSLGKYLHNLDKDIEHKPAPKKSYREIFAQTLIELAEKDLQTPISVD